MKKYVVIFASSILIFSQFSFGSPIDKRQERQQTRIANGVVSGELTKGETRRLERQQTRIAVQEAKFKSDGIYGVRERALIQNKQNRASANIFRQKHDSQKRK